MKKLYIIASLLIGAAAFSACEEQDTTPVLQEPTTFVLNEPAYKNNLYDLENSTSIELSCSQPDYGFTAATSYAVEVSLDGNFTSVYDAKQNPEGDYLTLATSYSTAKMNVDASEFAEALTALTGIVDESMFPIVKEVYVRLKASLTASGEGVIYSNTIVLPSVRIHFALPSVTAPEKMYLIGDCNNWDWGAAYEMVPGYDNAATNGNDGSHAEFWSVVYLPEGGFKVNFNKAWDGGERGFAQVTAVDNASAGLADSGGNIGVATAGWYIVVVRVKVEGRDLVYTVEVNKPEVYLMGTNAPVNDWTIAPENLFTVPDKADGVFVSPKFAYDTDGDGGIRACVSIEGLDWWKTEFMVFDGELKYRATGGDQDRVNGKKGQVLKIDFLKGTGSIE
ncbi:MAG: SusF/SusE family outer membrane protein [Bacteroidales bacterium]|nr:SusF/SusE family outer membrane protein [Bacteroidales bacterium]